MREKDKNEGKGKRRKFLSAGIVTIMVLSGMGIALSSLNYGAETTSPEKIITETETPTLKVYGEEIERDYGFDVYTDWWQPFDPYAIAKDSVTFNPALMEDTDWPSARTIKVNRGYGPEDAHEKKYLRMWYEPDHFYGGAPNGGVWEHMPEANAIVVESTYMMMLAADYSPQYGFADGTYIALPIEKIDGQFGMGKLGILDLDGVEMPSGVSESTEGKVYLSKSTDWLSPESPEIRLFDHKIKFLALERTGEQTPTYWGRVEISYIGNYEDVASSPKIVKIEYGDRYFVDRHNDRVGECHPMGTWFVELTNVDTATGEVKLRIGKAIEAGDTFYVNGVRYDVPAVFCVRISRNGEPEPAFKYITFQTPLPKLDTSIEEDLNNVDSESDDELIDFSVVSSQWLKTVEPYEILPIDPPFNGWLDEYKGSYRMVDDINIPHYTEYWYNPFTEDIKYTDPGPGYDHYEICDWNWCTDPEGPPGFNLLDLIHPDYDEVDERLIEDEPILNVIYVDEAMEKRFHGNQLEIPEYYEGECPEDEAWCWRHDLMMPHDYTEFLLPARSDINGSYLGDYLLVSSFIAPNSECYLWQYPNGYPHADNPRLAFYYDVEIPEDIYVNEYDDISTLRVYGENCTNTSGGTDYIWMYYSPEQPFDPIAMPYDKDIVTFNPAIILSHGTDFDMDINDCHSYDANEKKYLRMWYEPDHWYNGPNPGPTADAIMVEGTYMMTTYLDNFPMHCWPKTHIYLPTDRVEGQYGFGKMDLLTIEWINGTDICCMDGTIDVVKQVSLEVGGDAYTLFDHQIRATRITTEGGAKHVEVEINYTGNPWVGTHYYAPDPHTHTLDFGNTYYFTRTNTIAAKQHPTVTWHVRPTLLNEDERYVNIEIGKELKGGDVFYFNGVRYEIPALHTLDPYDEGEYAFKYITMKAVFPKNCDTPGEWKVDIDGDGIYEYKDFSWVSTQFLKCTLEVDPPFNGWVDEYKGGYNMVDDINIPHYYDDLWEYIEEDFYDEYLREYIPEYLYDLFIEEAEHGDGPIDMIKWLFPKYEQPGYEYTCPWDYPWGMYYYMYPHDVNIHQDFDTVEERIIKDVEPLVIEYIEESYEPRYHTNLLELLYEDECPTDEDWTWMHVYTMPKNYTEFVLPIRPDIDDGYGDYILTTSFWNQNYSYKISFWHDAEITDGIYVDNLGVGSLTVWTFRDDDGDGWKDPGESWGINTTISIDGHDFGNWGAVTKIGKGMHTISFSDAGGCETPSDMIIRMKEGEAKLVLGAFKPIIILTVKTFDDKDKSGGFGGDDVWGINASIYIDGEYAGDWGTSKYVTIGDHTITFVLKGDHAKQFVKGFLEPVKVTVTPAGYTYEAAFWRAY